MRWISPTSLSAAVLAGLTLLPLGVQAACAGKPAGIVREVTGTVALIRGDKELPAKRGLPVLCDDGVRSGAESAIGIMLRDRTMISLGADSELSLAEYEYDPQQGRGRLDARLNRGSLAAVSGRLAKTSPDSTRFKTPTITLGVRGTEFTVELPADPAAGADPAGGSVRADGAAMAQGDGDAQSTIQGSGQANVQPSAGLNAGTAVSAGSSTTGTPTRAPGQPPLSEQFTLLPDAAGGAGAIDLIAPEGRATIDQAYQIAELADTGTLATRQADAASVLPQVCGLLGALPTRASRYVFELDGGDLTAQDEQTLEALLCELRDRGTSYVEVVGFRQAEGATAQLSRRLRRALTLRQITPGELTVTATDGSFADYLQVAEDPLLANITATVTLF